MSDNKDNLEKAAHYWKNKDPKKYASMLSKLRAERKKKGSKERATQQVLQAKRREKGGAGVKAGHNGTGHSKNQMKTKTGSAVKRFQSSEKKSNAKLSIDRKNNSEGYGAGNTRNIPQSLNRGRHHADPKKLARWKKSMKKSDLTIEDLQTLLLIKAHETGRTDLVKALSDTASLKKLID